MVASIIFSLFGLGTALSLLVCLILLVVLTFEVAMFIHAVGNQAISDQTRMLWLIGMLFIHPIVAIVYYFTDYNK
ncbi:MAG TPA: hypothetical protein VLF91_02775 [Candidatus Saccharimonadales bacterium]|nr:hypothetical protein [Candidatus Saccharimonadales bacterium]